MGSAQLLGGCLAAVFLLFAADKAGVISMRQPPRPAPSLTTPGLAPPPAPAPAPAATAAVSAPARPAAPSPSAPAPTPAPAPAPAPAMAAAVPAAPPAAAPAFDPGSETPDILPAGPGRDDTFHACIACHSTALIRRSGFTRAQWDDLMDWMTERQNMPPLDPELRRTVVDYLAEHFPPRRAGPRGGRNPFAD